MRGCMNKKAMINQIDVDYRDIQNIDNQYYVMSTILKLTKKVKKQDIIEEKNNVAMGQQ